MNRPMNKLASDQLTSTRPGPKPPREGSPVSLETVTAPQRHRQLRHRPTQPHADCQHDRVPADDHTEIPDAALLHVELTLY
jgi:hypothetical protein